MFCGCFYGVFQDVGVTEKFAVSKATESALNFPNQLTTDKMAAEAYLSRGLAKVAEGVAALGATIPECMHA